MTEFRSGLENLMEAVELRFPATPRFGSAYKKFLDHATAHPAKMNTRLLEFLVENFTVQGDVLVDPMAGTGSLGVVAAVHGRNAVCVDLEEKFFKWMEKARKKVEAQQTLTPKGRIKNICGDARQLSKILKKADVIVTSPPYSKTIGQQGGGAVFRDDFQVGVSTKTARKYSDNPFNIGNLSHGNVDVIVTSPPYSESLNESKNTTSNLSREQRLKTAGHLPKDFMGRKLRNCAVEDGARYSHNPENIGNLPHGKVDCVLTSPPYEDGMSGKRHTMNTEKQRKIYKEKNWETRYQGSLNNIGNFAKQTYLEAMFQVYSEMYSVLKPDGKAIIVIKPFIRNKKVVDLPHHTWLLLEKVGFKLAKLFKLRLKNPSFWRILYRKKYPNVPKISHEYILIASKS